MADCLIALGANLGPAAETLEAALAELGRHPRVRHLFRSRLLPTQPAGGPPGQPAFVNGAARFETDLSPQEVLGVLQAIERALGRQRHDRWGPRTLDLDLLLYDECVLETPALTLPHPRLAFRRFVLEPAAEIAADMVHPITGLTIGELRARLNEPPHYLALGGGCWFAKMHVAQAAVSRLEGLGLPIRMTQGRGLTMFGAPPVDDPAAPLAEHYCDLMPRLAGELHTLLATTSFLICRFWPAELELAAEYWFTGAAQEAARQAFCHAFANLPPPKLVVFLETPDDLLLLQPGRSPEYDEHARRLAAERNALEALAGDYRQAPLLKLSAARPEPAIDEVVAAVQAMRP